MPLDHVFSWDPKKAEINLRKHGLSFQNAIQVFLDPNVITRVDRIENGEERWQTIGMIQNTDIVLVAHTVRTVDDSGKYIEHIRIISARKADKKERGFYGRGYF